MARRRRGNHLIVAIWWCFNDLSALADRHPVRRRPAGVALGAGASLRARYVALIATRRQRNCWLVVYIWLAQLVPANCQTSASVASSLTEVRPRGCRISASHFRLGMDGISLLLVLLTAFLGLLVWSVARGRRSPSVGFFHFNLMWLWRACRACSWRMDLFLFYFFWEMMLIPMYFLIGIWGHERRVRAAMKFFLFTQVERAADAPRHPRPRLSPPAPRRAC